MAPPILVHETWTRKHDSRTRKHEPRLMAEKCLKCGDNETKASIRVLTDKKEMKKKKMLKESV